MYKNEVRKRAVSEIIEKKVIKVKKKQKTTFYRGFKFCSFITIAW